MQGHVFRLDPNDDDIFAVKDDDGTYAVFEVVGQDRKRPGHRNRIEWEGEHVDEIRNLTRGESCKVIAQELGLTLEQLKGLGIFRISTE